MVARLAKRLHGDRGRALPVGPIHEELDELAVAEARSVLIAPAEASLLPGDARSPEALGNELERLYASLEAVTPDNHPRTARLLAASNRKVAQKVIEEAGEVEANSTVPRVGVHGPEHPMTLETILKLAQHRGQTVRGNRQIVNDGQRPRLAATS